MANNLPIQFAISSNEGRSGESNGSKLVNLFAETLTVDSKTQVILYGTPGQYLFSLLPTAPVAAMIVMGDELYAVTAKNLYKVAWNGTYKDLGAIDCGGSVSIATSGYYLVFVNGRRGWAYNSISGLIEMQGAGWYPANTVTFQDGYFIFNRTGSGQFFFSGILDISLDGLDYSSADASPDNTVAIISDQRVVWLFGEKSIEIYRNDGSTPWVRLEGAYIERGTKSPASVVKMDNCIFFLGDNGVVYRTSGYTIQRESSHAIEFEFLRGDVSGARAYSYTNEGHVFYVLTIPAINRTIVFDVASGLWHERSHSVHGQHNGNCYAQCYGKHLIGDFQSGNIFVMDMDAYTDDGDKIVREAIAPVLHPKGIKALSTMYGLEIDIDTVSPFPRKEVDYSGSLIQKEGFTGAFLLEDGSYWLSEVLLDSVAFTQSPVVKMQWSDDGLNTWSNERFKPFGDMKLKRRRVKFGPMGQYLQRHIRIMIDDPVPIRISGAYAEVVIDA